MKQHLRRTSVAALLALTAGITAFATPGTGSIALAFQDPKHDHEQAAKGDQAKAAESKSQAQMMARMKQDDAKVAALVARMNKATGDAKVAVMAELLTVLTQSRADMQQMMAACPMGSMGMMGHAPSPAK